MENFFLNYNIRKLILGLAILGFNFFIFFAGVGNAADCTEDFSWLPNSEPNIAGYKIYYGQSDGGPYPNVIDAGNPLPEADNRIHASVTNLTCGEAYFFVCVAVNDAGLESPYSNQTIINASVPGSPTNLMILK